MARLCPRSGWAGRVRDDFSMRSSFRLFSNPNRRSAPRSSDAVPPLCLCLFTVAEARQSGPAAPVECWGLWCDGPFDMDGSIDDLFLLRLNVVGVAGQQQQQSSAQGLGWPSCGRSAGGWHCRRAGRPTRRGSRRLRSCWGDTSSPASTGGSLAQLLLLGVLEHGLGLVCRDE